MAEKVFLDEEKLCKDCPVKNVTIMDMKSLSVNKNN